MIHISFHREWVNGKRLVYNGKKFSPSMESIKERNMSSNL